jgi:hypothetical protein
MMTLQAGTPDTLASECCSVYRSLLRFTYTRALFPGRIDATAPAHPLMGQRAPQRKAGARGMPRQNGERPYPWENT